MFDRAKMTRALFSFVHAKKINLRKVLALLSVFVYLFDNNKDQGFVTLLHKKGGQNVINLPSFTVYIRDQRSLAERAAIFNKSCLCRNQFSYIN